MNNRVATLILVSCLMVMQFTIVQQSPAALGEPASSVAAGRRALSASQPSTTNRAAYTVQETKTGANSVREYISPSGIVFSVAWNGISHPDLVPLLGSYTDEYRQALQQKPRQRGQRRIQVKGNRVVVEKWGHMRNLRGRAYVSALIPAGVTIDEIK